jgi:hypothetical protein
VTRLVLDAGAFVALDRNDRSMWARLANAHRAGERLITHAGIVGQVWRHPSRQARLAAALKAVDIRPLTVGLAQAAGLLLAATRTSDVHDAALASLCEPTDVLITSDVDDLGRLLAERSMTTVGLLRI